MSFMFSFLQLVGWMFAGYSVAKHNFWAVAAFVFCNMFLGLAQALAAVGKELRGNGSSSKSE